MLLSMSTFDAPLLTACYRQATARGLGCRPPNTGACTGQPTRFARRLPVRHISVQPREPVIANRKHTCMLDERTL
jgi:hypothetical protein